MLEGKVYLGDNGKEFEEVNSFIDDLKNDEVFRKYFKSTDIESIRVVFEDNTNLTRFTVSFGTK